jgi:23S rRNA pseudouridine1911/1915/1917 synthase
VEYSIEDLTLYKDDELIAINKPAGILVQGDESDSFNLWTEIDRMYDSAYLINRIDRPVSGAVIFALSKKKYNEIISKWNNKQTLKRYVAIIEGSWSTTGTTLEQQLIKGRNNKAIVKPGGKPSSMKVSAFPIFNRYSLCMVQLHTGRFHQIRAMLSHEGHIIKGDVKYGARRKNHDRSIHLHCYHIDVPGIIDIKCALPDKDILWEKAEEFLLDQGL